jgi:hypothetical protein
VYLPATIDELSGWAKKESIEEFTKWLPLRASEGWNGALNLVPSN